MVDYGLIHYLLQNSKKIKQDKKVWIINVKMSVVGMEEEFTKMRTIDYVFLYILSIACQ